MLIKNGLSRRKLLRMTNSAMLFYPLMRALQLSEAKAATILPRVVFTTYSCGSFPGHFWGQNGSGSLGGLGQILAPLEAHKADLMVLQGICTRGVSDHSGGPYQVLAGYGMGQGAVNLNGVEVNAMTCPPNPYSLDQMLGDRWGAKTIKKQLLIGSGTQQTALNKFISYTKAGMGQECIHDPGLVFNDLFGSFSLTSGGSGALALASQNVATGRKRIIDYLLDDVKRISSNLGEMERSMFEAHVATLDEISQEIKKQEELTNPMPMPMPKPGPGGDPMPMPQPMPMDGKPPRLDKCSPKNISASGVNVNDYATVRKLNNQIMVQALACGITRVGVIAFTVSSPETNYGSGQYHVGSHLKGNAQLSAVQANFIASVAELASMLKSVPTSAGSLFDETLIHFASDISEGTEHNGVNIPSFLLGKLGGKLKGGRQVGFNFTPGNWSDVSNGMDYNRVLVSVAHLLGETDIMEVGSSRFKGPIPEIVG